MTINEQKNRKNRIYVAIIAAITAIIVALIPSVFSKCNSKSLSTCDYLANKIESHELEIELIENRLNLGIQNDSLEAALITNKSSLIDLKKEYSKRECE